MNLWTLFLFLSLYLFSSFTFAALGIAQDETSYGYYHWSSAMRFAEDPGTVTLQLPGLARQAYEEMLDDAQHRGVTKIPVTMAALAVGSDVYFSSGLKGGMFLVDPGSDQGYIQEGVAEEVQTAIIRCQQTYRTDHRYNLACAEPLAVQQYLVNNEKTSIVGLGRISTYGVLDPNDQTNVGILNPCADWNGKWGCDVFMSKLQISIAGNQGDKPDLPNIAPIDPQNPPLSHCFWT